MKIKQKIKYFLGRIHGFFFNLIAPEKYKAIGFHEDGWNIPSDFSEKGIEAIKKGIICRPATKEEGKKDV